MRTYMTVATALLAALSSASGQAATCTITETRVIVRNFDLDAGLPTTVGLPLPVTIDEAAGTLAIDFRSFPLTNFEISGVAVQVDFAPDIVTGTIDASGDVTLPQVTVNLVAPGPTPIDISPTLSTGIAGLTVSGTEYATQGSALNFVSGALLLEGQSTILAAPMAPGAVTAGVRLACTLSPTPNAASLPKGPTLDRPRGQGKLRPTKEGVPPTGDTLALTARFTPGASAVDPTRSDVFVRVRDAAGIDVVLARVAAGDLISKGKRAAAADKDGSKVRLVTGRKVTNDGSAKQAGRLAIATGKALAITLAVTGVDLGVATAGAGSMTVTIGDQTASVPIQVRKTKKRMTIGK